jgi:hypothetical protein
MSLEEDVRVLHLHHLPDNLHGPTLHLPHRSSRHKVREVDAEDGENPAAHAQAAHGLREHNINTLLD